MPSKTSFYFDIRRRIVTCLCTWCPSPRCWANPSARGTGRPSGRSTGCCEPARPPGPGAPRTASWPPARSGERRPGSGTGPRCEGGGPPRRGPTGTGGTHGRRHTVTLSVFVDYTALGKVQGQGSRSRFKVKVLCHYVPKPTVQTHWNCSAGLSKSTEVHTHYNNNNKNVKTHCT